MKIELVIPGRPEPAAKALMRGGPPGSASEPRQTDLLDAVEVVDSFNLSPASRARTAAPERREVNHDDILEIEVEGGFTLWTSVERYRNNLALLRPSAVRGDAVDVDLLPRPSASERGVSEWVASALRVLRLHEDELSVEQANPARWAEFIQDVGLERVTKVTAWLGTKFLIWLIERRLTLGEGLYAWTDTVKAPESQAGSTAADLSDLGAEEPILVFIHGTASSTQGSFGALADSAAQADWRSLVERFGRHIYAFEHRTLSASPIENAINLVRALPSRARVSLVTHSRGGLVGDLVCLREVSADAIGTFQRRDEALADADSIDRRNLQTLVDLLASRQLRIERYLRCACPARGTLLASENTDQFLSVLTNLVGLIPGLAGSPLYEVVKRTTLEVARNRWQPKMIPGIEAMTPTSPLVQFLNTGHASTQGTLGVVAGDIEGGHWLKRLGVFLTDQFLYDSRDNDLVVNTDSMFNGLPRAAVHYVFDQGGDVTHFNYFRNERTRAAMLRWVTTDGAAVPGGFEAFAQGQMAPVPMARSLAKRASVPQPIVFVLPGIMGSHLQADEGQIWLNFLRLATGGLGILGDVAALNIRADALIGEYYGSLCDYLSETHEVVAFAYDWRRSIADSAALLAQSVEQALARTSHPVRLVAHSMGGLVVRQMIKDRPDLWEKICSREGGRFVMLGTPNRGSHSMVEALVGAAATIQRLALLDLGRDLRGVIDIIQRFPGALQLLPHEASLGFFKRSTWDALHAELNDAAQPDAATLEAARAVIAALPEQLPQPERVLYVAGSAAQTVEGIEVVDKKVVLLTTTEGDGSVTYASGRLPGVLTWYMDAEHGDLAASESGFSAINDLLTRGTTSRLPTTPPSAARGGAVVARTLPQPVLYPTEADLTAGLLGRRRHVSYRQGRSKGFRVSVTHGDLRYARYPIVVGHYEGDTIIGAESRIDQLLEGALSTRYNLGLYPGSTGSIAVILRDPTPLQRMLKLPNGAVVIGLGRWGELTAAQLSNLIRRAALQYVLQLGEGTDAAASGAVVGLTLLLIGTTSTANISTDDSVGAILRGIVQANRELKSRTSTDRGIEEIEIVEVYADTAIQAARAARRLAVQLGEELDTEIEASPLLARGRNARTRLTPILGREPWRRWEIGVVEASEEAPPRLSPALADRLKRAVRESADGADPELLAQLTEFAFGGATARTSSREIKFVSLSDRARAEVLHQQRQPELIERLIRASINETRFRPDEARALFELLVPNDLKDGLAQLSRVIFVVDAETAQFPWELMTDGKEPLATRMGLVRQLKTARYRPHIRATTARTAYVVGDPIVSPPFNQLEGARKEAQLVNTLLKANNFVPKFREERQTALEVLGGLFEQPYRVIHLAGHGHYVPPTEGSAARSGMVLDNGVFLTAVEIGQMQQVPELVFLDCCYIGQVGPDSPGTGSKVEFNRLAASISRELIEMGVRAVVAAGWAVRDDAALFFARIFYTQMLEGQSFGRALLEARSQTWQQFPDCNTWGAYQAYGDPDFRLDPESEGGRKTSLRDYVSPSELVNLLSDTRQVAGELGSGERKGDASKYRTETTKSILEVLKDCPSEWKGQSQILVELGLTFGDLGDFENATSHLSAALETDELDSVTSLTAVQRLANYEARLGQKIACAAVQGSPEFERGIDRIKTAISRLIALGGLAKTSERLSLLASCYKRLVLVRSDPQEIRLALEQCARHYREAHEHNAGRGRFDPYPALNWMIFETLLGAPVRDAETLLTRVESSARERFARSKDYFDAVAVADAALVRALRPNAVGSTTIEAERIASLYEQAVRVASATPSQIDSTADQFKVIEKVLSALAPTSDLEPVFSLLAKVRERIGVEAPAPVATAQPATGSSAAKTSASKTTAKSGAKPQPSAARRGRARGYRGSGPRYAIG